MTPQTSQKKTLGTYTNDNVLESLRSVCTSVGSSLTRDVAGNIGADVLQSLFGTPKTGGELKPNQAVDFDKNPREKEKPMMRPRMEYGRSPLRTDEAEIKKQIEAVRKELQTLASSVQKLHQEIHTAVAEVPVNPGIYHLNFFEHLKTMLIAMREQVDDSRSWLTAFMTRKKKIGYWGMVKKHGTSFGMSSERSIATQAG